MQIKNNRNGLCYKLIMNKQYNLYLYLNFNNLNITVNTIIADHQNRMKM